MYKVREQFIFNSNSNVFVNLCSFDNIALLRKNYNKHLKNSNLFNFICKIHFDNFIFMVQLFNGVGLFLSHPFLQIAETVSQFLVHFLLSTMPRGLVLHPAIQILRELSHPTLQVTALTVDIIRPTIKSVANSLIWDENK